MGNRAINGEIRDKIMLLDSVVPLLTEGAEFDMIYLLFECFTAS